MSAVSRILVLGESGSGKSAFVHCASAVATASRTGRPVVPLSSITAEALSKSPTVGIDVAEIQYASNKFVFTEIGGSMAPIWQRYFEDCDCIMFVVDANDPSIASNVLVHLARITSHPSAAGKPLVIVFSKADGPCTIPRNDFANFLRLKDYKRQLTAPLETAEISCVSFIGIDALLQLLQRTCQATGVVPVKVSRLSTERH